MGDAATSSAAVTTMTAMIAPGLFILGSASLVASALVRMGRVVDRARLLAVVAQEGSWEKLGIGPAELRVWLERHARRARYAERSIALLYIAVVVFVATCLAIVVDRALDGRLSWLPIVLAVVGTLLLLAGGANMVTESSLSGDQIGEEIRQALQQLEETKP